MSGGAAAAGAGAGSCAYRLTYFDGRGLAEVSRLLFAISKVAYVDERVPLAFENGGPIHVEWDAKKNDRAVYPFSRLPVLHLSDGTNLPQSRAIERFLAKKFGLFGANEVDSAVIDSITEQILDYRTALVEVRYKKDEGVALNDLLSKSFAGWMELLEQLLERRKSSTTPYFVGDTLSYADIVVYYFLWHMENGKAEEKKAVAQTLPKAPKLAAVKDAVANLTQVQEYVAKRPLSTF